MKTHLSGLHTRFDKHFLQEMARATDIRNTRIQFESYVTGHHVYKGIWSPFIEEEMLCEVEPDNIHDKYAIKVLKDNTVVGHVPRELSRYCCLILNSGGQMESVVTGARENKRGNGIGP